MSLFHRNVKNADAKTVAESFIDFVNVVAQLRDPEGGCPWDLKQDHKKLRKYMIEEAFEAAEAMGAEDEEDLVGELGDVLLQVILNAQILSEGSKHSITDVIGGIAAKMRRRHPHVFANENSEQISIAEVKDNWQKIKAKEAGANGKDKEGHFAALSKSPYSSLRQAFEIGKRSQTVEFDWSNAAEVLAKLKEEISELEEEMFSENGPNEKLVTEEFGDVLFSAVQLGRHLKIEPELALYDANRKFLKRFAAMEALEANIADLSAGDKEKLWQAVKEKEK